MNLILFEHILEQSYLKAHHPGKFYSMCGLISQLRVPHRRDYHVDLLDRLHQALIIRNLDFDAIRNGIGWNHNGMNWREIASDSIRSGASRKRWRVGEEELELHLQSEAESNENVAAIPEEIEMKAHLESSRDIHRQHVDNSGIHEITEDEKGQKRKNIVKQWIPNQSYCSSSPLFYYVHFGSLTSPLQLNTISENQSLSGDQTIVFAGGMFELGLFKPGQLSNYYIGIWYSKQVASESKWYLRGLLFG
ncbi:hypothetical protein EV1_045096 [Malus domestica]